MAAPYLVLSFFIEPWQLAIVLAAVLSALEIVTFSLTCLTIFLVYFVLHKSSLPAELRMLRPQAMDILANDLLTALENDNIPPEMKMTLLGKLKTMIKQHYVPPEAIIPCWHVIRRGLTLPPLVDITFSTMGHLIKRLVIQQQKTAISFQFIHNETYTLILDCLGDQKERIRLRASQALTEFWSVGSDGVESIVRELALIDKNSWIKLTALQWLARMNKEHGLQFRTFVPGIIKCLGDVEANVREAARMILVDIFQSAPNPGKLDLRGHLQQAKSEAANALLAQFETAEPSITDVDRAIPSRPASNPGNLDVRRHIQRVISDTANALLSKYETTKPSITEPDHKIPRSDAANALLSKYETTKPSITDPDHTIPTPLPIEAHDVPEPQKATSAFDRPLYVSTTRELDGHFEQLREPFSGRENEENWKHREKSVIKIGKLNSGNAPSDFLATFVTGIKGTLDDIVKAVTSLRTSLSMVTCQLIQDIAKTIGPSFDQAMIEILLSTLIKTCAQSKKIGAQTGNATVCSILDNVVYNTRILHNIWLACQDKNIQPRLYATNWLKMIITKHGIHKSTLEHAGGLDIIEKCIKKGLTDANPGVREGMRPTYWVFWQFWPNKTSKITSTLSSKQYQQLLGDAANPSPKPSSSADVGRARSGTPSRGTATVPGRPSLKETMLAQKRAKVAAQNTAERPVSAQASSSFSSAPIRRVVSRGAGKVALPLPENRPIKDPIHQGPSTTESGQVELTTPKILQSTRTSTSPQDVVRGKKPPKIYEDPIETPSQGLGTQHSASVQEPISALEEIPLNKSASVPNDEPSHDPQPRTKDIESRSTKVEDDESLHKHRMTLGISVELLRNGTLDSQGIRKLHDVINTKVDDIWVDPNGPDGWQFEELLNELFSFLETADIKPTLKVLAVNVVRDMDRHYQGRFAPFRTRTINSFIFARRWYVGKEWLVRGLEESIVHFVSKCDRQDTVEAVLCCLDLEDNSTEGIRTMIIGLNTLCRLLDGSWKLSREHKDTIASLVSKWQDMGKKFVGIRMGMVELCATLHKVLKREDKFWDTSAVADRDFRSLVAYFVARNAGEQVYEG